MIGDAVLYAASRATHTALENVSWRITWAALAGTFFVCALVFGLILGFWLAAPIIGPVNAAAVIALACLAIALVCMLVPWLSARLEQRRKRAGSSVASTVAVVDDETKQVVDYFGALQVVGAAFLFGLGAARRLKR